MAKIDHLQWNPTISVHVDSIDDQHKKLFEVTNHLIDAFEAGSDDFLAVISELVNYTTIHFHDEQLVLMNEKYPGLAAHTQEHNKFIGKLEEFLQLYDEDNKELGFKMVVFLKDWLADHTSKMDMEYAAFMADKNRKPR